jgi:hypothetical protein
MTTRNADDRGWQLALGLIAAWRAAMFLELYADCSGHPVDSIIRDVVALRHDDPSG